MKLSENGTGTATLPWLQQNRFISKDVKYKTAFYGIFYSFFKGLFP